MERDLLLYFISRTYPFISGSSWTNSVWYNEDCPLTNGLKKKIQVSRGPLHKAAINGQLETIKVLLESREDVDKKDQV